MKTRSVRGYYDGADKGRPKVGNVDELPGYVDMEGVLAELLPKVGIVFVHEGCLWADSTPVDDAILYDKVLTHNKGHNRYWRELQARGAVPRDLEYDEIPRGRACYDTRAGIYHLYLDRCILRNDDFVLKIMRTMELPFAPLTEVTTDSHYKCSGCLRSPEEGLQAA